MGELTFNYKASDHHSLSPRTAITTYLDIKNDVVVVNIEDTKALGSLLGRENITKLLLLSPSERRDIRRDYSTKWLHELLGTHFPNLRELYFSVTELPRAGCMDGHVLPLSDPDLCEGAIQLCYINRAVSTVSDSESAPLLGLQQYDSSSFVFDMFSNDIFDISTLGCDALEIHDMFGSNMPESHFEIDPSAFESDMLESFPFSVISKKHHYNHSVPEPPCSNQPTISNQMSEWSTR